MSVQSPFAERRARLGIVSRPVVIRPPRILPQPIPPSSPDPPKATPSIPRNMFQWAHALADQYGGDAAAFAKRGQWRIIRAEVCCVFGVDLELVSSPSRLAGAVWPRMVCAWALRSFTPMSYPQIGRSLGGRDHSSILHAYRTVNKVIDLYEVDIGDTFESAIQALAAFKTRPATKARA